MPLDSLSSSKSVAMIKDGGYLPGYIKFGGPDAHATNNWDRAKDGFDDFISDVGAFFSGENKPVEGYEPYFDESQPGIDDDRSPFVETNPGNPVTNSGGSSLVSNDGTSAESVGSVGVGDILSGFSNSASSNDLYMNLYQKTGDMSYLEKYIDNLVNRENTASARDYETQMSNTSFSRLMNDIKKSGYNPWLALNANGTSTPSVSASGVSQISRSDLAQSKENNIRSSLTNILGSLLGLMMVALIHSA